MKFAAIEDAQRFLANNPDIDMIELFILDANGVPRGKLLHREELLAVYESGRPLPSTILGLTLQGDDVKTPGWCGTSATSTAAPTRSKAAWCACRGGRFRRRRCRSACTRKKACRRASPTRVTC
jgi:glutamine synthetase